MVKAMGVVFAGALLVVTAGCTPDSFTLLATHKRDKTIMPGSPESVSMAAEACLRQVDSFLGRSPAPGDTIRIEGRLPNNGERFTLFLRKLKGEPGEKTEMRVDWEKNGNDVFWNSLIGMVLRAQNQPQITMMPGQQGMPQGMGGMPPPQGFPPPGMQQPSNGFSPASYPPNPPMGNGMPPQGNYVPQGSMYQGGNPAGYGQPGNPYGQPGNPYGQ